MENFRNKMTTYETQPSFTIAPVYRVSYKLIFEVCPLTSYKPVGFLF